MTPFDEEFFKAALEGDLAKVREAIAADPFCVNRARNSGTGSTALMATDQIEIIRELINARADVNAKNNGGATALIYAVTFSNVEKISLLLAAGADITPSGSFINITGTALEHAYTHGDDPQCARLIERAVSGVRPSRESVGLLPLPTVLDRVRKKRIERDKHGGIQGI